MSYEGKVILDACCGGRMFWFDKTNQLTLFADIRKEYLEFKDAATTRTVSINPDIIQDFTQMLLPDNSFKLVVFDPPHLKQAGETSYMAKKYGRLGKNWKIVLHKGFKECFRVLDNYGVLIFKWNETQVPVSDILKLVDTPPLFGHRSGKQAKTVWLVFMKMPK